MYIILYLYTGFLISEKRKAKKPNSPQTVPSPQEFMILPVGAASFREALQIGAEVWHCWAVSICGASQGHEEPRWETRPEITGATKSQLSQPF